MKNILAFLFAALMASGAFATDYAPPSNLNWSGGPQTTINGGTGNVYPTGGDDYAAITAKLAATNNVTFYPGLTYLISHPIVLGNNQSLNLNSAILKAQSSFTGSSMIRFYGVGGVSIIQVYGGVLDGNWVANTGVENSNAVFTHIHDLVINRNLLNCILEGSDADGGFTVYNNDIDHITCDLNPSSIPIAGHLENSASSIGIYSKDATDGRIADIESIGYRIGFENDKGVIDYAHNHAWTRRSNGPMVSAFTYKGDALIDDNYADTPTNWYATSTTTYAQDGTITAVYGHSFYGFAVHCTNLTVYISPDVTAGGTDGVVYPFYFDAALSGGAFGYILGAQLYSFTSPGNFRFAALWNTAPTRFDMSGFVDNGPGTYITSTGRGNYITNNVVNFGFAAKPNIAQSTLSGTTAGSVTYSMPFQGSSYKNFVAYASGYENNSAGNQTITFPVAFTNTPIITGNGTGLAISATTTTLTITAPNNTTLFTGNIIIEGY